MCQVKVGVSGEGRWIGVSGKGSCVRSGVV